MTDTLVMIAGLLADEAPKDTGPDFGKASPFGLLIVVLLLIGTFLLVRSMNRHLKRLPESFDRKNPEPDQAVDDGTVEPDAGTKGALVTPGNTLGEATSPYLRQHADNPVHWRQWTPDALAEAAERDVPILLSIGYAACHWCHVMAHESFEDDDVAAAMNAGFVCIKVDREERPDIDAVYMNATVALTGQGGWPMTCFLTPDGRPFFCGTYYPKPNFLQLLAAVSDTWQNRRDEVEQASDQIIGELRSMASGLARRRTRAGARPVRPRRRRGAERRGHRQGRIRRCAQVPAVGAAGGAAAQPRTHRRACAAGGRRTHRRRDGPRRHLRPARRWIRPLQRRRLLGGAALREDALRQRVAAAGLRALGAPHRKPVGAQGHRRDGAVHDRRAQRRRHVHLLAGRRRRRHGRSDLRLDARPADRGARRGRRTLGRRRFSASPKRAPSSTAARCCSYPRTPTTPNGSSGSGPPCWPPG